MVSKKEGLDPNTGEGSVQDIESWKGLVAGTMSDLRFEAV